MAKQPAKPATKKPGEGGGNTKKSGGKSGGRTGGKC
jgi:hypothetical protein